MTRNRILQLTERWTPNVCENSKLSHRMSIINYTRAFTLHFISWITCSRIYTLPTIRRAHSSVNVNCANTPHKSRIQFSHFIIILSVLFAGFLIPFASFHFFFHFVSFFSFLFLLVYTLRALNKYATDIYALWRIDSRHTPENVCELIRHRPYMYVVIFIEKFQAKSPKKNTQPTNECF